MSITHAQVEISLATTSPADVPIELLPVVEFNDDQISEAKDLARKRSNSYREIEGGQLFGDLSCSDAHLVGIVGELAIAELYGGQIDDRCHQRGDDGFDLNFGSHSVDVKTTRTQALDRPDLLVSPHPEPCADLYFLTHWFDRNRVRIIGYATRSNVVSREPIRYPGESPNHVVPPDELLLPPEPIVKGGTKR